MGRDSSRLSCARAIAASNAYELLLTVLNERQRQEISESKPTEDQHVPYSDDTALDSLVKQVGLELAIQTEVDIAVRERVTKHSNKHEDSSEVGKGKDTAAFRASASMRNGKRCGLFVNAVNDYKKNLHSKLNLFILQYRTPQLSCNAGPRISAGPQLAVPSLQPRREGSDIL